MLMLIMLSLYFGLAICLLLYLRKIKKIKHTLNVKTKPKLKTNQNYSKCNVKTNK